VTGRGGAGAPPSGYARGRLVGFRTVRDAFLQELASLDLEG